MRLLEHTPDGGFRLTKPIPDDELPAYAILSHTWGSDDEEVSFEDLNEGRAHLKELGYRKLKFLGAQAARDGLRYFWCDTCCIKKTSDAELSEALNSMFRWYQRAVKCYVFLTDVCFSNDRGDDKVHFRHSRWFTRGWTLQELLAPADVEFYGREGEFGFTKESMGPILSTTCGIPLAALNGTPLSTFTVDERLNWAARRTTKRKEDQAYCLLGIFGVFISPIYGEGDHAFYRLREAIEKKQQIDSERQNRANHDANPQKSSRRREEYLNSLQFEHIEDRYNNIKSAHPTTCQWMLTNPKYQAWMDDQEVQNHHGLLWLKGKPGAGKSTLTKFVLNEADTLKSEDVHISFFFNARGTLLEKDTRGMYRSLLYQLLTELPQLQSVFDEFGLLELPSKPLYDWTISQLQDVFSHAIDRLKKGGVRDLQERWLWIYVDALDECDEDQIRDMVSFFERLCEQISSRSINLRVFFASRYYPRVTASRYLELRLENVTEHTSDIERYIHNTLKSGNNKHHPAIARIREELKRRASGVFIWVVLVIQVLNKAYDHGRIHGLEKKLREIPDDLGELFKGIIVRDAQNMESTRLCLQWILFAQTALTPEELYFAISAGTDPEDVGEWDPRDMSTEDIDAFILSCSKGLAEITTTSPPTVQFIHETIRDFFLKDDGMPYIQESPSDSIIGASHDTLKQCCINYVTSALKSMLANRTTCPIRANSSAKRCIINGHGKCYLIQFFLQNALYHAEVAQTDGIPQEMVLNKFLDEIQPLLDNDAILSSFPSRFSLPLITRAVRAKLPNIVKLLLENPRTDVNAQCRSGRSLLSHAAECGDSTIFNLILAQPDVQVNLRDHDGRPPLHLAIWHGHEDIVDTLLQHPKADVALQDHEGWNAIHYCTLDTRKSILQKLLNSGRVDASAITTQSAVSPLHLAACWGQEAVAKALMETPGVDDTERDGFGYRARDYTQVLKMMYSTRIEDDKDTNLVKEEKRPETGDGEDTQAGQEDKEQTQSKDQPSDGKQDDREHSTKSNQETAQRGFGVREPFEVSAQAAAEKNRTNLNFDQGKSAVLDDRPTKRMRLTADAVEGVVNPDSSGHE